MSYTPINWQTGDTITAVKLNKMDNGWEVQSTQLFSETITTESEGVINYGIISYASIIDSPTIIVTFDDTSYTCAATEDDGNYLYGAPLGVEGPDFSDFPFQIESTSSGNTLYTETAGEHTVAAVGNAIATSSDFYAAVGKCLPILKVVPGVTTFQEVSDAIQNGLLVYGWDDSNGRMFYAVTTVEDSDNYLLYAITSPQGAFSSVVIISFSASSTDSPLELT